MKTKRQEQDPSLLQFQKVKKNAFEFGFTKEFAERKKKKKLTTNYIQIMTVQKKKNVFLFHDKKKKILGKLGA